MSCVPDFFLHKVPSDESACDDASVAARPIAGAPGMNGVRPRARKVKVRVEGPAAIAPRRPKRLRQDRPSNFVIASTAKQSRLDRHVAARRTTTEELKHPDVEAPGRWVTARETAVHDQRSAVHVARLVASEEQGRARNLVRLSASTEWIEFANPLLLALRASHVVDRPGHPGLDQAGADCVDSDSGSRKLLCRDLAEVDHCRLRRLVSRSPR